MSHVYIFDNCSNLFKYYTTRPRSLPPYSNKAKGCIIQISRRDRFIKLTGGHISLDQAFRDYLDSALSQVENVKLFHLIPVFFWIAPALLPNSCNFTDILLFHLNRFDMPQFLRVTY